MALRGPRTRIPGGTPLGLNTNPRRSPGNGASNQPVRRGREDGRAPQGPGDAKGGVRIPILGESVDARSRLPQRREPTP